MKNAGNIWKMTGMAVCAVAIALLTGCGCTQDAQPQVHHLEVKGMTCEGCVKKITKFLGNNRGISEVHVSLEEESASFTGDGKVNLERLLKALESFGYTVRVAADSPANPAE